jgi:putative ABC transport system substrate-binding protein
MKRRRFITLFAAAIAAWPVAGWAQESKPARIGVLVLGSPTPELFLKELRQGLESLGHVEGRTIRLEIRNAGGKSDRLNELAAELVADKANVIVAFQTPAALAAKRATSDIPIVMAPVGDALGTGLVASLARPEGNVTGISAAAAEIAGKTLELLRELKPTAQRVAVLANEIDSFSKPFVAQIERDARTLGLSVQTFMVRPSQPMDDMFKTIADSKPDFLMIQGSLTQKEVIELASKHRLAAVSSNLLVPKMGGLLAYAASQEVMYRRAAVYVDRILKGAKPSELPVEQPTKYGFALNLNTAKALGLTVPPTLLARADEVIE